MDIEIFDIHNNVLKPKTLLNQAKFPDDKKIVAKIIPDRTKTSGVFNDIHNMIDERVKIHRLGGYVGCVLQSNKGRLPWALVLFESTHIHQANQAFHLFPSFIYGIPIIFEEATRDEIIML